MDKPNKMLLPTVKVIDDKLFVNGNEFEIRVRDVEKISTENKGGRCYIEIRLRKYFGEIKEIAENQQAQSC